MKRKILISLVFAVLTIIFFIIDTLLGIGFVIAGIIYLIKIRKASIYAFIAQVRYSKGFQEDAIKWFEKAIAVKGAKNGTKILYAYLLLKRGNVERSEKLINEILASNPSVDDKNLTKSNLALILWKKGQLEEAVGILEEIIKDFKTTNIYGSLGYFLILKGDLQKALELNLEAYEYNNSNSIILDNLAHTYFLMGESDKAEEIFKKLMDNSPTFPEAYFDYGLLFEKTGRNEEAAQKFEKALTCKFSFLSTITIEGINEAITRVNP